MEKLKLYRNLRMHCCCAATLKCNFHDFVLFRKKCNEIIFTLVLTRRGLRLTCSRKFKKFLHSSHSSSGRVKVAAYVSSRCQSQRRWEKSILVNLISSSVLMNANCLLFFSDIFAWFRYKTEKAYLPRTYEAKGAESIMRQTKRISNKIRNSSQFVTSS